MNISELCELAGGSCSGYYRWLNAEPVRIKRESQDRADFELILQVYWFCGYDKGIRGIHMRLLHLPQPVQMNVKKIQLLMRKYDLSCPIRKANPYRRMAKALKTNYYNNFISIVTMFQHNYAEIGLLQNAVSEKPSLKRLKIAGEATNFRGFSR